jgi:hypothetical protein
VHLEKYDGKNVRIVTIDGEVFVGFVYYFGPGDENENGENSIIVDLPDGRAFDFDESDILSIEVVSDEKGK